MDPNFPPLDSTSQSLTRDSSNSVPFPSPSPDEETCDIKPSDSSASELTSSDKLSALPAIQSSPALGFYRNTPRTARRSLDANASLPSIESSPGMAHLSRLPTRDSDVSVGKETPRQRVSFDSDKGSLPAAVQSLRQTVVSRLSGRADPGFASPSGETSSSYPKLRTNLTPRGKDGAQTPASRSPTQSRAASPLRFFGWNLHRNHSRDEPFIPVDPFQFQIRFFASPSSTPRRSSIDLHDFQCEEACTACLPLPACTPVHNKRLRACGTGLRAFFVDSLPRQVYLHFLFRLPALYFTRVSRIFEDAEVSKHEIQRMIEACMPAAEPSGENGIANAAAGAGLAGAAAGLAHPQGTRHGGSVFPFPVDWNPPSVSPALARFKHSWEQFVDSLLREWKTLNLVSVLLCTALLTMFQIPDAAGDPITRWAALFSMIFSIMSLTYGCIYIVQFGTMRSMYKASRWAEAAQKTKTLIWWNIWVLLAMPAIWLAWAMAAFCVAILSYIWRTGSVDDPADGTYPPLSRGQALAVRTALTVIFGLGLVYFILILRTFGTYGEREVSWRRSWLATGHPAGRGMRARERREEAERGRGRMRQRGHDRSQDQQSEYELKQSSPTTGLGLLGVSGSGTGMANMTGVMQDDTPWDKTEKKEVEEIYITEAAATRGKGKISPKL